MHLQGLRRAAGKNVPVLVFHLIRVRMPGAVRRHHAVAVKGAVRGFGSGVIAPESEECAVPQGLVLEVPNEAALVGRVFAHQIPILFEAAHGIAHGVGIFALDERPGRVGCRILLTPPGAGIHGAHDVRAVILRRFQATLVLDRAGRVIGLDPGSAVYKIGSGAGLIAQAPDDDRRVVEVPLHHALVPDQVRRPELRVLRQGFPVLVAHAMGLDVALVHYVQAVAVAEREPQRVVRIMAGAYRIDIELFHDANIANHIGLRHHIALHGA